MIRDTLQIRNQIIIDSAALGSTQALVQTRHMVLLTGAGQGINGILCGIDAECQFKIHLPLLEQTAGIIQYLNDLILHLMQLFQSLFTKRGLGSLHLLRLLCNILRVISHSFKVVDHMEERAHQLPVVILQLQGIDLHQILGNIGIEEIEDLFIVFQFLHFSTLPLNNISIAIK